MKCKNISRSFDLPTEVETRLRQILDARSVQDLLKETTQNEVKRLAKEGHPLSYEEHWASFALLYFNENFRKVFRALLALGKKRDLFYAADSIRVLDMGCGGGASTVGLLCALGEVLGTAALYELDAIDHSPVQLRLFRKVVAPWIKAKHARTRHRLRQQDAFAFLQSQSKKWDMIVASYLFCELVPARRLDLEREIANHLDEEVGFAVIVDQDPIQKSQAVNILWPDGTKESIDKDWILKYKLPGLTAASFQDISNCSSM